MTDQNRILVVDDETNIRRTLVALLQRAGHGVASAESGEDAVAMLAQQQFDLLLVDLKMPGMDGMQVVAAARACQPDIAIIVLTGHGSLETAVEGLHQGIFDYLLKTIEPPVVVERVAAALAKHAQMQRQRTLLDMLGSPWTNCVRRSRARKAAAAPSVSSLLARSRSIRGVRLPPSKAARLSSHQQSSACCSAWPNTPVRCSAMRS